MHVILSQFLLVAFIGNSMRVLIRNLSYNQTQQPCIKTKGERSICINLHKFRKDIHGKLIKSFFSDSDPISRPLKEKEMRYTPVHERHMVISIILFYPITLEVRRDTTDELATIPFHLVLFSAALVELTKSIPVRSLILSSHLFFSLPLFFFIMVCLGQSSA